RKSRTALSLVALMVGVAAIIVLVSLVDGIEGDMQNLFGELKTIDVMEKGSGDQTLSVIDISYLNKLESVSGVNAVVPQIYAVAFTIDGKGIGEKGGGIPMVTIVGVDQNKRALMRSTKIPYLSDVEKGRDLRPGDKGKIVLTKEIAKTYKKVVGSKIKVGGEKFEVVGIMESSSSSIMSLAGGILSVPLDDARKLTDLSANKVGMYMIEPNNPEKIDKLATALKFKFDEFDFFTSSDYSSLMGDMLNEVRLLLFLVGAISGFIAGVGIMNTMLMSVMERTKEIGVLRSLGWTGEDVLKMILFESLFLGIFGGIIGGIFGWGISSLLGSVLGIVTSVNLDLFLLGFVFAVCISILGGLYPAFRASRMSPIEVLRE
ncbi:MAG: ABC transporter permease, partial [Candidatus Diapherotrites archaeon]|nr:ABC transporter permease [Candidatus Diapherotrites archaeon]